MNNYLINLIGELNHLYEDIYNYYEPLVLYLIKNNIKDIKLIENYLDNLLSIPTEKSYNLYMELCNYYESIDKNNSMFYIKEYKKIYKS